MSIMSRLIAKNPASLLKRLFTTQPPIQPKIVVFGGNGYVGKKVLKSVLDLGYSVVSVNRSGAPNTSQSGIVDKVKWVRGDILKDESWIEELNGAIGAVSCVGAFGSDDVLSLYLYT